MSAYKADIPDNSFLADIDDTPFTAEFLDNRELDGTWYCIIRFGDMYIAGESHIDKYQSFLFALHDVLVWLHDAQVSLDEFWLEIEGQFDEGDEHG